MNQFRLLACAAAWAAAAPCAFAQPAPAPPVASSAGSAGAAPENPILLTPFEVKSEGDAGYYGANTLSGTRINSKVQDLGASITVVTKQQLIDTAANDINDIFKYEAGVEGIYDFTATISSAPTNDVLQGGVDPTATRVRGLGAPNVSIGNFASTPRIPIDTYNIDSVEISRGPNSTLFGLGNPSGTININRSEAIMTLPSNELVFKGDSYGGYRASLNFNRPVIRDVLAIRFAALYSDTAYLQKPSYDLMRRLYGTFTYHPFQHTTIKGSYEHYRENAQRPNFLTPRDAVTEWVQDGRPTWNPLTQMATVNGVSTAAIPIGSGLTAENNTLPAGLQPNAVLYTRPTMYIDGGQVQLWEIGRQGNSTNPNAGASSNLRDLQGSGSVFTRGLVNVGGVAYQIPGVNNQALYNWTNTNAVPENWNYSHASLYTLVVEQEILHDLYFRGGWFLAASDAYSRNVSNPPWLEVDVNQYLPDGRPNPYFLRPFTWASIPTISRNPEYNDNLQGQLAYDLDLPREAKGWLKWLGHHRMLGYYESRHVTDGFYRYRDSVTSNDNTFETSPYDYANNNFGQAFYRYYVGPPGALGYTKGYTAPKSGPAGTFDLRYFNPAQNSWVDQSAQFGQVPYVTSQSRQEITSRGAVLQSSFWNDRIIYSGGIRKDFNRSRTSFGAVVNPATGIYDEGSLRNWNPWQGAAGLTRTNSIVVKPLPWFGLSYDQADSFLPQTPAVDLFDNHLPNTYSHGRDVGAFVNLFNNKLVLGVKIYRTEVDNARNSDTTLGSRIARLEDSNNHTTNEHENLYDWAMNSVIIPRLGVSAPADQLKAATLAFIQLPPSYIAAENSGEPFDGVNNTLAKGAEVDVTFNPVPNWNLKFTATKTQATNTSLEDDLAGYIALRMPLWTTIHDDQGNLWWTQQIGGTIPQQFYIGSIGNPLQIDQALLGKSNPQVKEYAWRFLNTYRFLSGPFKNGSVGGSVRWNSRSVIGYGGAAADPDGIVRSLDINRAFYDPSRFAYELWTAYRFKIFEDRIRTTVQLNVQDPFQNLQLRTVGVNPDGTPYNYRIIYPRKFILTVTFDF